jgi:murein DD-endopeptidase MepM/ murein hydrolase activator NlpD
VGRQFSHLRAALSRALLSAGVIGVLAVTPAAVALPAGTAGADVAPQYPMTMPVDGEVESLFMSGCSGRRNHTGIDISNLATSTATEIHAAYPGVAYSSSGNGYGLMVDIVHQYYGGSYITRYAHLSSTWVPTGGAPVNQGDVIGMMGRTGSATGVHLHFEVLHADGVSAVPLDINAAFACRTWVTAGTPMPIEFPPLEPLGRMRLSLGDFAYLDAMVEATTEATTDATPPRWGRVPILGRWLPPTSTPDHDAGAERSDD